MNEENKKKCDGYVDGRGIYIGPPIKPTAETMAVLPIGEYHKMISEMERLRKLVIQLAKSDNDTIPFVKMVDYEGPVPEELCTIDAEGGADDFVGCGRCFDGYADEGPDCENCIVNRIFREYALLTGQIQLNGGDA